ncbi:MAG: ABC transporter substrate-binding protein [Puniceicoccales bacterium]|jgi:ABC-type amino acid transport substrate-binding protein|nr:ABC transporter substrate-binding protein [Puniceicoccales bacterium]
MKKLTIVVLSILMGMLMIWFYHKSSNEGLVVGKEKNVICFGTCADYPPMEYYRDGTLTGFEIELAKLIGQKLKKGIVLEDMAFGPLQIALGKGFIEAFVAAFGVTPEGRDKFDFTIPYYIERMVFLHKKGDPITRLEELSRKKIIYQLSGRIKKTLEENIPEAELISVDRIDVAMEMFKAGHGDCVYMDVFVADVYCEENPQWTYLVLDSLKVSDGIAIVLPKGSPLRVEINRVLKALEASGELQALRKKWKLEAAWKLPNE